jgi:DNA-binding NtrC family response regulator
MQKQAVVMSSQFVVSGERIEIRPLVCSDLGERYSLEGRFPTLLEIEQEYVQKVLAHVAGNKSRAAEVLGIDRVSLWRKLKKLDSLTAAAGSLFEECSDRS